MQIPFGQGSMNLEFEKGRRVEIVSPKAAPPDADAIRGSIANPIDFQAFDSFVSRRHRILVVVNDHTRSTPTAEVLKELPLRKNEVTTIIASGSHRAPDAREIRKIVGGEAPPYGGRVVVHNCRNTNSLKRLGRTSRGTEVYVNSLLFDADGIILVSSVEPHYFGGFTGG